MITKNYNTVECTQSVTIHPNGDQAHGIVLHDINGVSIALMGYVVKNGEIRDAVFHNYTPRKQK